MDGLTRYRERQRPPGGCAELDDLERIALLRLVLSDGVGAAAIRRGIERVGSAQELVRQPTALREAGARAAVSASQAEARRVLVQTVELGVRCVAWHEDDYPTGLLDLEHPPALLFVRGDLQALAEPCVAIVGSRRCTASGREVARDLARSLSRAGVVVVSGLALGIDGAAHQGALEGASPTVAVVAGSVERPTPRSHAGLAQQILRQGGVLIAEHPPGTKVRPFQFPIRNRILAGLARGVVLVEAADRSGALHTVDWTVELGRTVMVVPGPIDRPTCRGSNRLLSDGGVPILEVQDVLDVLGLGQVGWTPPDVQEMTRWLASIGLDSDSVRVWQALDEAADVEGLAERCALDARQVMAALARLEVEGLVRKNEAAGFVRAPR